MSVIQQIVERSHGAYTHDEVFMLEAGFIQHLNLMFYETDSYQARLTQERNKLNT